MHVWCCCGMLADISLTLPCVSSAKDLAAKLQELTGVVAGKQILLFGPPYTRLDSRKPLTVAVRAPACLYTGVAWSALRTTRHSH